MLNRRGNRPHHHPGHHGIRPGRQGRPREDARHGAGLKRLTQISRTFDERLNRTPNRHAPYVGASAFALVLRRLPSRRMNSTYCPAW